MATHELKTHPEPFQAMWDGRKPFDIRKDDREPRFAVGDWLHCREWDPATEIYSGRMVAAHVSYAARDMFGVPTDHVVLGLIEMTNYPLDFV